jgi:hypothetical protein
MSPPPGGGATDADRVKPTPAASAPTPAKPAAPVEPQVVVFTEKEYPCQSGDSFESLSKRFYADTDKYAAALRRHNQNHARASDQMQRSGKITPGETIFVPPADILEQRYPDAIEKAQSSSAPGTVPASFSAPSGSPAAPPSMTPASAPPLAPVSPPTSSPSPTPPPPPAPLPTP